MPSVRELMRTCDVSLSTALMALRWMEEAGLVEAKPRIGYFVRRTAPVLNKLPEPDLRAPIPVAESLFGDRYVGLNERISLVLDSARRADIKVDLGGATPGAELFDAPELNKCAALLLRQRPELFVQSRVISGAAPEFQAAMARRALEAGIRVAPGQVLPTSGNTEALHLALCAVARPGDVVAVESPTYYGLLQMLESQGLKSLEIPCSPRTGVSLEALELAVRTEPRLTAIVVMPHLQMPQGTVMPDSQKARLVAFSRKNDLALIEDDSYRLLVDGPMRPRPAKAWDESGHVIYCESFNKTLAPGIRQGWMSAGRWHERVSMLKFAQSRSTAQWAQLLAARWSASPAYARHLTRLRTALRSQREQSARALARYFPPGARLSLPPGGLSLWVELPPGASSSVLFEQALRLGIRIAPGSMFSNTGKYDGFIRLGCVSRFTEEVDWAYQTLGRLLSDASRPVPTGVPPQ